MSGWFRRLICFLRGRSCKISTHIETGTFEGENLPYIIRTQWHCTTCGKARRCEWRHKQ